MGRFYFHIRGPVGLEPDELGLELGGADQAYLEAYRAIPRLAADLLERGRDPMQSAFEISDDQGRLIMEVPFSEALGWSQHPRPRSGHVPPSPRSRAASASVAQSLYRAAFEGSPSAYLILTPELRVIGANDAYLAATETRREQLVDQNLFDVFPENPEAPTANGVRNLTASFERALRFAMRDVLPRQRYDIRGRDGAWLIRYWTPTNWPIFDEDGSALALVQHVVEAT